MGRETFESIGISIHIQLNTIDLYLLADIAGDEVIITNGLEENQTIILAGQSNVKDGQKVKTETASVTPSAPKSE